MDTTKVFGSFPDGFRMSYKDLMDTLLSGETPCATGKTPAERVRSLAMERLEEAHGGAVKMYWCEDGMYA